MASSSYGSLQHIFENPLPENPTLLQSLSFNQTLKPIDDSSFTELFGELHFKETNSEPSIIDLLHKHVSDSSKQSNPEAANHTNRHKSSESLQLCTEGLGFESSDDVEDMKGSGRMDEYNNGWEAPQGEKVVSLKKKKKKKGLGSEDSSSSRVEYPPPISCIGRSGKPWVCFKSYRDNGRFVLKEIRIPTQEFLHACREDGRLKLHFVLPDDDDELLEEMDEEEEEEDVEGIDEGEEEEEEEDDGDCIRDQVNEEKEIDV